MSNSMKRFVLDRKVDHSGVSGTGIVAEGIVFSNGKVAMTWTKPPFSMNFYDDLEDVEDIHGHEGSTEIIVEPGHGWEWLQ